MKQNVPLVRSFSALEPYQEAYTLACSLETEGQGCWLTVSRTKAPDDPADTARPAGAVAGCYFLLVSAGGAGRKPAGRGRVV